MGWDAARMDANHDAAGRKLEFGADEGLPGRKHDEVEFTATGAKEIVL